MPDPSKLYSFSLTHVQYDKSDPLGKLMAVGALIPIALLVSYVTLLVSRRDLVIFWMFLGQLLNELTNYVAKKTIKQPRPTSKLEAVDFLLIGPVWMLMMDVADFLGKGYGMPSSHAQFMAYFAVFFSLHVWMRVRIPRVWKVLTILIWFGIAALVAYSRVHLSYHTVDQVNMGTFAGMAFGVAWYVVTERLHAATRRSGVLNHGLLRWLMIRDTRWIADITALEYRAVVDASAASKKR
ncbi:Dolichyldiphosphatase 1 [Phlyctochytrium bullatum]|nr:Dolichyldiphosphatase 1 [Phlyctochytrium bullatum]